MKTSKNDVTLKNIAQVIDETFDRKFDQKIDQKLAPVFDQLGALKQQISDVNNNLGAKINSVDAKLEEFRKETKANFTGVYDGMSSLAETLDHDLEPRIKNLERRQLFA